MKKIITAVAFAILSISASAGQEEDAALYTMCATASAKSGMATETSMKWGNELLAVLHKQNPTYNRKQLNQLAILLMQKSIRIYESKGVVLPEDYELVYINLCLK